MSQAQDRAAAGVPTRSSARHAGDALPVIRHPPAARLPAVPVEMRVGPTDPALRLVTDFSVERPVTVDEDCQIDQALVEMQRANVRSMLVLRGEEIAGLVTSYDIQGERPMRALRELGFHNHADLEVRHIMSSWDSVPMMELGTVREAQVQQVVEFFRHSPATHLLIVEGGERGGTVVRGLISRTRVERQVGFSIA